MMILDVFFVPLGGTLSPLMVFSSSCPSSGFVLVGWPSPFLVTSISLQLGDNSPYLDAIPLPWSPVNLVVAYVNLSVGWVSHKDTLLEKSFTLLVLVKL